MQKYLIIIGSYSTNETYCLTIFSSGNKACIVKQKDHSDETLRKDMIDCLKATEVGVDQIFDKINTDGWWANEFVLSDECCLKLGWVEPNPKTQKSLHVSGG